MLPIRSKNPPESFPFATIGLIVINVFVFALTTRNLVPSHQLVSDWGVKWNNLSPVTLTTSMFLHGGLMHILGNMWFLYLFGFAVEGRLRTAKFLLMYFVAGYCGGLLHMAIVGVAHPNVPCIGASGAIMGVMGAALYMFPHAKVTVVVGRFYTTDWPMWGVGLMYIGLDMLEAFVVSATRISGGVANLAHLGGVASGFLVVALLRAKRDSEYVSEAKATIAETRDYGLLRVWELKELAATQPTNTLVALHWLHKSFGEPGGPREECIRHFMVLLPKMISDQDPVVVGGCVSELSKRPGLVPPKALLDLAFRVEKQANPQLALMLLQQALACPELHDSDREAATFRLGMVWEAWFNDKQRASTVYQDVVQRWPMSPIAEQAKLRLSVLAGQANAPQLHR